MTPQEAQNIVIDWIKEIAEALPPHHKVLPEAARNAIIADTLAERFKRAAADDGPDKEAFGLYVAYKIVLEELAQMQPRGKYDPEALLSLSEEAAVRMDKATKEHVQQWRDHMTKEPEQGCNYGNMLYADARLSIWGEEKTLAELEAVLSSGI